MHKHEHGHGKTEKNILTAFFLNIGFAIFELIGGFFTSSVSIISDAVHDAGDALSIGLSFLLGGIPSGGAFILITIICEKYGKGFETSFLLLKPAALIFCSFASLLDTVTAMFGSYIIAVKTKMVEHHVIHHFI